MPTRQSFDEEFMAELDAMVNGPRRFQDGGPRSQTKVWEDGRDTKQGRFSPNAEIEPHEIYPTDTDRKIKRHARPHRMLMDEIINKILGLGREG